MFSVHQKLTFGVKVDGEVLEDIHVGGVRDGGHGGRATLAVDVGDGLRAHTQHQRVHQGHVVPGAWLVWQLDGHRAFVNNSNNNSNNNKEQ